MNMIVAASQVMWSNVVTSSLIKMFHIYKLHIHVYNIYYLTINPAKMSMFDFVSWHFCLQILFIIYMYIMTINPDKCQNLILSHGIFPSKFCFVCPTCCSCHMMWLTIFKAFQRPAIDRWYCLGNEKVGSLFLLVH
jgi:hypothetical protein